MAGHCVSTTAAANECVAGKPAAFHTAPGVVELDQRKEYPQKHYLQHLG